MAQVVNSTSYSGPERRANARQRVLLGGKIITDDLIEPFECTIRSLTLDGASISIAGNARLPETFRFSIPSKECVLRGHLVWRDGQKAGVYFDGFDFGALELTASSVSEPQVHWRN